MQLKAMMRFRWKFNVSDGFGIFTWILRGKCAA